MLRRRIIPALLLHDEALVKTRRFRDMVYIGDPCNTVRIFNELEVDELMFLDISATRQGRKPNLALLGDIANECFMPLGYGGAIRDFEDAKAILKSGFEKIVINSFALERPDFITKLAEHFGSQAVVVSIDVKKNIFGNYKVATHSGKKNTAWSPVDWAQKAEQLGAGEILLTSIDREGSWEGFDDVMTASVVRSVGIPVIGHGGAGSIDDISQTLSRTNASAVALGSLVVFQKKGMGVLVNFPDAQQLAKIYQV